MGMQWTLSRGVTRMVVNTARDLNIKLPLAVVQLMYTMADLAWQPLDELSYKSAYPNIIFANDNESAASAGLQLDDSLHKWSVVYSND